MKTIFLMSMMMISFSAEARLYINCDGRVTSPDPQNRGMSMTENIYLRDDGGTDHQTLTLTRTRELHDVIPARAPRKGDYVMFGGETNLPANSTIASALGKNIELFATGRVDFFPNYGPFGLPGRREHLGTLRLLNPRVAVLQLTDRQEMGLTCRLVEER